MRERERCVCMLRACMRVCEDVQVCVSVCERGSMCLRMFC